jgi:hypothetical protein
MELRVPIFDTEVEANQAAQEYKAVCIHTFAFLFY